MEYHIKISQAQEWLRASGSEQSADLLQLGSLAVRFYAPNEVDRQQPHTRDEVYVVASGSGTFRCCGKDIRIEQGDVLTVPAQQQHRFVDFSPDFAAWVFFYGPEGGEGASDGCCSGQRDASTLVELSPSSGRTRTR